MGFVFSCFRSSTVHQDDEASNHNNDVTNLRDNCLERRAARRLDEIGLVNQPQKEHEHEPGRVSGSESNCLGTRETRKGDEIGLVNHAQKEHELGRGSRSESRPGPAPALESDRLIIRESLKDDCIISRDEECPICLEEYTSENPRITTKCSHSYHLGCIYDWQERSGQCPICLGVMEFQEIN